MRRFLEIVVSVALFCGSAPQGRAEPGGQADLLAFSAGALIERASPSYGSGWEPLWLLDEEAQTGWANQDGTSPPFEIVISLAEQSRLTRFGFDTAAAENPERSARDVDILISDQSGSAGFTKIMSVVLEAAADGQLFQAPAPATGRWVKLVIRSNHGDAKYWEIMNVHGFGAAVTSTPITNVSGTYASEFGNFHLAQTDAQLVGCYDHHDGLVQGGLEDHLMRLTWTENKGANTGPAVMVQTRDGRGFQGLWRNKDDVGAWHADWTLKKISNDVGSCPHWRPAGTGGNLIAEGLRQDGRATLYGITFDTDSDKLRPEAASTLTQLAAALKSNAGWTLAIEGHTDSTSTPSHNLDLSARRAAAVKAYLVGAGIAATRLQTQGLGQDRPVASNDTALGRAQNRRVEVVRQ